MELIDRQHQLEGEIHRTLERDSNCEYHDSIPIVYRKIYFFPTAVFALLCFVWADH